MKQNKVAVARGATVNNSGDLNSPGYVIAYLSDSTASHYNIRCPDCSVYSIDINT